MSRSAIFTKLRADHRRVLRELDAADRRWSRTVHRRPPTLNEAEERRVLARLDRQFATHMQAEDHLLFPALAAALPESRPGLEPLAAEHEELRALLAGLVRLVGQPAGDRRDEQFRVRWRDFAELLRIHIRKEESLVFGLAERLLRDDELERIESMRFPARPAARRRVTSRERKSSR